MDQLEGTVLLHVQTAAIAVDELGRVGVFNPAAARVLDVPVEHVLGHQLDELTAGEPALAALAGVLQETRRSGVAHARRQVTVDTPAGVRTLGYTASLLGGGGATALFFTDLTDAIAEERRVAEAQRFAEVGRIAGAMAHELKSPLATVELYANLLRRALVAEPAHVQQLDIIKDQTRRVPRPARRDHALHQPRRRARRRDDADRRRPRGPRRRRRRAQPQRRGPRRRCASRPTGTGRRSPRTTCAR